MPYGAYSDPDLLDEAREVLRSSKDLHQMKRAQAVLFPVELNITLAELARAMNTTQISLARWRREFLAIFEGQEDRRQSWGGERCRNLTETQEDKLLASFEEKAEHGQLLTIAPIQAAYEKKLGREVKDSVIYRMLERHGWRKLAPRHKHKKADGAEQDEWKKKTLLETWKSPAVKAAAKGRPLRLMFSDEARFGRVSDPRKCWGPSPKRPVVETELVREYTYAFAAVSPSDGKFVSLILPKANTWSMNLFLKTVSKRFKKDYIILVVDRASWHKSKTLIVPENIMIVLLPAYSPELNPAEHIWAHLRENYFHNKCFKSIQAVEKHLSNSLEQLRHEPAILQKMTCWSWIKNTINLKAA